jgi:hypothetical protein
VAEDAGFFNVEDGGVVIELGRECLRAFDLFVHVYVQWFRDHKKK